MADIYVDSSKTGGANNGTSWTDAYLLLESAVPNAGDVVFVASGHTNTTLNVALADGTQDADLPITYISCSNAAGPPTTYTRGAVLNGSTGDINFNFTLNVVVFIGFDFTVGDDFLMQSDTAINFVDCKFIYTGSGSGSTFQVNTNCFVYLDKCVFKFNNAGHGLQVANGTYLRMVGCSIDGAGSAINNLIQVSGDGGYTEMVGCDWSNMAASGTLCSDISGSPNGGVAEVYAYKTKLPTSGVFTGGITNSHSKVRAFGCSTGTTAHAIRIEDAYAVTIQDVAVYRSATNDGTTGYSLKMVTTGASKPSRFGSRIHLCDVWAAANSTITVELVLDNATILNESQMWIEIVQPNTTAPLGTIVNSNHANFGLGTPADLASSTVSWTGTGGFTNLQRRKLSKTISGGAAGVHSIFINAAVGAVRTIYIDPHVDIT